MKKLITITLLTFLLLTQTFAQSAKSKTKGVDVEYDRSKDKTTITAVLPLTSNAVPAETIVFGSIDVFSGKTRTTPPPEKVIVTFISVNKKKQFAGSRSWVIVADDERLKLGKGEYVVEANDSGAVEILLFVLSVENLKKIIDASKVEMEVGNKEFTITEAQLEVLRAYYKQLVS